jgi:hypothetical protein
MGLSEEGWKRNYQQNNQYQWNIGDTTLETRIALNGDGISSGTLRLISLNLSTVKIEPTEANDFVTAICPSIKFERAFQFLQQKLGKPDSVRYQTIGIMNPLDYIKGGEEYLRWANGDKTTRGKIDSLSRLAGSDTVSIKYYFHNRQSIVLLKTSKLLSPTSDISHSYFTNVGVYQISAKYETELAAALESEKKGIRPKDIVTVSIYTKASTEEEKLYVVAIVDNPVTQFISLAEERKICSIKGRIVFKDNHGDSLLCYPDFILNLQQPLQRAYKPGLQYAMGEYGIFSEPYTETQRTIFVRINHSSVPHQLKSSFSTGNKIAATFIPESLLFTDGTTLKND